MPHDCSWNEEAGVFEIRSHGDISLIGIDTVLSEIERLRGAAGVDLVLVDVREQTDNAVSLDPSRSLSKISPGLEIAYLVGPRQPTTTELTYIESLFRSHGCTTRRFTARDDALQWLLRPSEQDKQPGLLTRLVRRLRE